LRASLNAFAIFLAFAVNTAPLASRAASNVVLNSADASATVPVMVGPPRSEGPICGPART
jgi:hypothetical protein